MGQARYIDSQDTFRLTLHGYCGMPIPIVDEGTMEECRITAARIMRRLRTEGFPVVTLEKGAEWEVQEPEDSCMVPDDCGILHLRPLQIRVFSCFDCGADVPEGESCDCHDQFCICGNTHDECSCNDFLDSDEEDSEE